MIFAPLSHCRPPHDAKRKESFMRDAARYGLQTMGEGGGMASATILELL